MAEAIAIIGLIASVQGILALINGGAKGVKLSLKLYQAPAEMEALQEQLQILRSVLEVIGATTASSSTALLHDALDRTRQIIEQLQHLITPRPGNPGKGTCWARRGAWFWNRREIVRLTNRLQEAWKALLGSVGAELLSSTYRLELKLNTVKDLAQAHSLHVSVAQNQLNEDHISKTPQWPCTTEQVLVTSPSATMPLRSTGGFTHFSTLTNTYQGSDPAESGAEAGSHPQPGAKNNDHDRLVLICTSPASSFETSDTFIPRSYTVESYLRTLVDYDVREVEATAYMRTKHCSLIYLKDCRFWLRLTVSITTSIGSTHWNTDRATSAPGIKALSGLPGLLVSKLEAFLKNCTEVDQDSHLSIFLGGTSENVNSTENCDLQATIDKPALETKAYLREITQLVRHWSCRILHAQAIGYRYFPERGGRLAFGAYLDSRWVLGHRFGSDKSRIDADFYHLQVLHFMQGTAGVSPLLGIVLDDEGVVAAFLYEPPVNGSLTNFMTDVDPFGRSVTLERRMRWCKQIVEVVASMHNEGLVLGTLGVMPGPPFGLDGNDNIKLFHIIARFFTYDSHLGGLLPPELRHLASNTNLVPACFTSDIYHLGHLLWRIAIKKVCPTRSYFCSVAQCHTIECTEPHTDPIQLPLADEQVPQYLKDMISACRIEDPDVRPSARKLLRMFPHVQNETHGSKHEDGSTAVPTTNIERAALRDKRATPSDPARVECGQIQKQNGDSTSNKTGSGDWLERYARNISACDLCGDLTLDFCFHCNTCSSGDYDLCQRCFSEGRHCINPDHYLLERVTGGLKGGYYSSVRANGQRVLVQR